MKLTGKCEKDFKKWFMDDFVGARTGKLFAFFNIRSKSAIVIFWNLLPFSMQIGVFKEFFDSVGLIIETDIGNLRFGTGDDKIYYQGGVKGYKFPQESKNRNDSNIKAVRSAEKIYNDLKTGDNA